MGRPIPPCGFIDGKSSIWHVRNCLRMRVETLGECATICSRNQSPHRMTVVVE
jgi:hypothetical protein